MNVNLPQKLSTDQWKDFFNEATHAGHPILVAHFFILYNINSLEVLQQIKSVSNSGEIHAIPQAPSSLIQILAQNKGLKELCMSIDALQEKISIDQIESFQHMYNSVQKEKRDFFSYNFTYILIILVALTIYVVFKDTSALIGAGVVLPFASVKMIRNSKNMQVNFGASGLLFSKKSMQLMISEAVNFYYTSEYQNTSQ